jgi:voltage-gated potassium channel
MLANPPPNPPGTGTALYHRWRFAVVLVASLLLAVAQPLTKGLIDEEGSFDFFFSILIVAVLGLVFEDGNHRRTAATLGLAALLAIWVSHGLANHLGAWLLVGAYLLAVCFIAFALYGILRAILVKHPSADAIFGAVCGYLLLGIIWGLLYMAVETASPGSFRMPATAGDDSLVGRPDRGVLSYYSFITLVTVGYGDVTPATPLTRTLAWIEAVTGQFYLAVLVAGLVGYKVTQALRD